MDNLFGPGYAKMIPLSSNMTCIEIWYSCYYRSTLCIIY